MLDKSMEVAAMIALPHFAAYHVPYIKWLVKLTLVQDNSAVDENITYYKIHFIYILTFHESHNLF